MSGVSTDMLAGEAMGASGQAVPCGVVMGKVDVEEYMR